MIHKYCCDSICQLVYGIRTNKSESNSNDKHNVEAIIIYFCAFIHILALDLLQALALQKRFTTGYVHNQPFYHPCCRHSLH